MIGLRKRGLTARKAAVLLIAVLLTSSMSWAEAKDLVLFQPGQSSWEWLLVPASHDGGKRMREGKSCLFCHENEEKVIGNLIVSGEKLEPTPISGLPGFIEMQIDASYDAENLYLNMSWTSPVMTEPSGHEEAATHLTIMLGSPKFSLSAIAGCWAACHSDLPDMSDTLADQKLTKYLPGSRSKMTKTGGGAALRPDAEIATQLADGKYLEFWQAVLDQGQLTAAVDGYFLQGRIKNDESAVTATASADGQHWTLEMVRPLKADAVYRHSLAEGIEYTLAVALHENHASGRFHFTSFPMRFYLGPGEAELNALPK
jgi:hypothetical protein